MLEQKVDIKENYIYELDDKLLEILLKDHSSNKNIIWATDNYAIRGKGYYPHDHIALKTITGRNGLVIKPRVKKSKKEQNKRIKDKAEVFTPSWICNIQNNSLNETWFDRKNVFNKEIDETWEVNKNKITFPEGRTWQDYVKLKVLEISCGEAPYLVSRYDTVSGEWLEVNNRIGALDRKIRVVNENVDNEKDWHDWVIEAYKSTFGFEWQGDSLLIARENLLFTFIDYYVERFENYPIKEYLEEIAKILSWNIWQMDGLKYVIPDSCKPEPKMQLSFFEDDNEPQECPGCKKNNNSQHTGIYCKVMNWKTKRSIKFYKGEKKMKFDFVIGNPPYNQQAQKTSTSDDPIYHLFMDAAYKISDKVILITPARFLMNAGKTPKAWNLKMLNDNHLKVVFYDADSEKVFPSASIPGGIAITYRDAQKNFGEIKHFIPNNLLLNIFDKVNSRHEESLKSIIYSQSKFNLNELYKAYPEMMTKIGSEGKDKRFRQIIMERFPKIFTEKRLKDTDIRVLGLINKKREYRFIDKNLVEEELWHNSYKVFVPFSNGSILSDKQETIIGNPVLGYPGDGMTQTFIGIGSYKDIETANNLMKYVKSKFLRIMLSVLKVTQGNKADTWEFVPIQDFATQSEIDWSKSIHEIDLQLYKKYNLTDDEIKFIETHVKEMK